MKYRIKKACGYYRVTKSTQGRVIVYTIMAQGTTIPRITYEPLQTFAGLYIANKVFNVWRPYPSHVPTFTRRCADANS